MCVVLILVTVIIVALCRGITAKRGVVARLRGAAVVHLCSSQVTDPRGSNAAGAWHQSSWPSKDQQLCSSWYPAHSTLALAHYPGECEPKPTVALSGGALVGGCPAGAWHLNLTAIPPTNCH